MGCVDRRATALTARLAKQNTDASGRRVPGTANVTHAATLGNNTDRVANTRLGILWCHEGLAQGASPNHALALCNHALQYLHTSQVEAQRVLELLRVASARHIN